MSWKENKIPLWARLVIIIATLPVLAYPWMLGHSSGDSTVRTLLWLYPVYVVGSAILAWICWPERRDVAWILIILMFLTHVAMYFLIL